MPKIQKKIKKKTESDLMAEIQLALGRKPGLVLWRLNQGAGLLVRQSLVEASVAACKQGNMLEVSRLLCKISECHFTRYGMPVGAPDLVGILNGKFFALEIKTSTGVQSKEQKTFQKCIEAHGGFYFIVRSVEEAVQAYEEAI